MMSFDDTLTLQTSALCIFYSFIFWNFFDIFQWGGVWTPQTPPSGYATADLHVQPEHTAILEKLNVVSILFCVSFCVISL